MALSGRIRNSGTPLEIRGVRVCNVVGYYVPPHQSNIHRAVENIDGLAKTVI